MLLVYSLHKRAFAQDSGDLIIGLRIRIQKIPSATQKQSVFLAMAYSLNQSSASS